MCHKLLAFQAKLEADTEYQVLLQEHHCADLQLRQLVCKLEPEQQEMIHQYLGALAELQLREIELALMFK